MDLVRVTGPADPVITLADAKVALRMVEIDDDDELIQGLVDTAHAWLDGYSGILGRCLIEQTWALRFDYCFPSWRIPMPLRPLISVDKIEYLDFDGATQTLDLALYDVLDGPASAIQPAFGKAWPAPRSSSRAVTVTYKAGYGPAAADVPSSIRTAMKMMVSHWYAHPEAVVGVEARDSSTALPLGVDALLFPFRARSVA